jgi:hypothetical protein
MQLNYQPQESDFAEEKKEFPVIPDGTKCSFQFSEEEIITSPKNPQWQGLKLKGQITDGEYSGRKLDEMITIASHDPRHVTYGRQTQGKIMKGFGLAAINDTQTDLMFTPVTITVGVKKGGGDFPNYIKAYEVHPHNVKAQAQQPVQPAAQQPAPAQGVPTIPF